MNSLLIATLVLIVAIPILLTLLLRGRRKPAKGVFQKNPILFSPEERIFHEVLRQATEDEFVIFGKIRVGDVIQPRRGTPGKTSRGNYDELARRCFPFVLCNRQDLSVACAVLLRDRGHGSRKSATPEDLLTALCDAAGLPVVPIATSPFYQADEVRAAVRDAIRQQPFTLPHVEGRKEPRISSIEGLDLK